MSDLYRIEACQVCGVLRLGLRTVLTIARERSGQDRPEAIGGVTLYRIPICETCSAEYDQAQAKGGEG